MNSLLKIFILLLISSSIFCQNFNNTCASASEIIGLPFRNDTVYASNVPNGVFVPITAVIQEDYEDFDSQSFTSTNLGSSDCKGYQNETSRTYRDTWYKKELDNHLTYDFPLYILCRDTIHISFYYGTCGNLFQNQCFTLEPGYYDGRSENGFRISQGKLRPGDSLFVQVSYSSINNTYSNTFIAIGVRPFTWPVIGGTYNANYERKVISNETTDIKKIASDNIEIYPNPFNNILSLNDVSNIQKIELYNNIGELIMELENPETFKSIKTEFYEKGIYYLKLQMKNNHSLIKSLVKI